MIKDYSTSSTTSNSVSFIYKAAKKRRMIALNNARAVQLECGLAPKLQAVK
ncbi:MAG: hypothetical protein K6A44_03970 [bacterium]|nr:hypothetical protein [bacterium]